ncbi:MAG: hypothetical protein KAU49_06685 [Candidatus Krumholzibacteria bacterium]|nr:hypothetical protein [Candidatus Krumholzibacteria bacterium]
MSDDLKLSLNTVKKEKKDRTALIIALLVLLVALAAPNISHYFRSIGGNSGDPVVLERVALKLEKQELYSAAAETWIEYIKAATPHEQERARILYRIGRMREQSGDYESALAAYYRSEQTAALPELEQEIAMAAERCLTRLARFAALRSEIAVRTSIGDAAESEVLAEIGTHKITRDMLIAMIEAEVDAQVAQSAAGMPADQVKAQREKLFEEVMKETDLGQWLERLVAEEILFRYAMEEELYRDPGIAEMSRRIERKLLTTQLLAREYAGSVTVDEDEMRAWYRANGAKLAGSSGLEGGAVPPFDEVKDQVYAAVRLEKEMQVQAALFEKLTDRYDVVIHSSKLGVKQKDQQK